MRRSFLRLMASAAVLAGLGIAGLSPVAAATKTIVYLTPGLDLPFWRYLSKGVEDVAKSKGYEFQALNSHNSAQTQLQNAQDSVAKGVAGIVISPTNSSTAPSVLALAKQHNIPVVIADIGTNSGDYESFVISDNYRGAHDVGVALAEALKKKGWQDGSVGLITISQARKNGQARTKGFLDGLKEGGATGKQAGLQQMQSYTADETFKFAQDMLTANPGMRGLFIQTDQPAIGALRAIKAARRDGELLVAAFDGIPGIRRPAEVRPARRDRHAAALPHGPEIGRGHGHQARRQGTPEKEILVPILTVTSENIDKLLPTVKQTVFANEVK